MPNDDQKKLNDRVSGIPLLPGVQNVWESDHVVRQRPDPGVVYCDFCSDPNGNAARYSCDDFTFGVMLTGYGRIINNSVGDVAACAACAALIDAGRRAELRERGIDHGRHPGDMPREILGQLVGSFQAGFWRALRGKRGG